LKHHVFTQPGSQPDASGANCGELIHPPHKPGYIWQMIEYARHVPLGSHAWSESDASAAINDIVADGLEHFDCERFWPAHPLDGTFFGHTGLYCGTTGMIWPIDYLGCVGATKKRFDFRPFLPRLMDASRAEPGYQDYAAHGSLLVGDLATALMVM
jgi:hypothetical protein